MFFWLRHRLLLYVKSIFWFVHLLSWHSVHSDTIHTYHNDSSVQNQCLFCFLANAWSRRTFACTTAQFFARRLSGSSMMITAVIRTRITGLRVLHGHEHVGTFSLFSLNACSVCLCAHLNGPARCRVITHKSGRMCFCIRRGAALGVTHAATTVTSVHALHRAARGTRTRVYIIAIRSPARADAGPTARSV